MSTRAPGDAVKGHLVGAGEDRGSGGCSISHALPWGLPLQAEIDAVIAVPPVAALPAGHRQDH